jgi:putative transcriptional regulator
MTMASERNLFDELMEGVQAMRAHREGKVTLRTHEIPAPPPPPVDASYIQSTRKSLKMSSRVFARYLRVNARTLERWEQGASPGDAASVLIGLVRRYPDTLARIAKLETASGKAAYRLKKPRQRKSTSRGKSQRT